VTFAITVIVEQFKQLKVWWPFALLTRCSHTLFMVD